MRLVDTIPHPVFKISVFAMELYFYVEIEAGPMKQCYKYNKDIVPNIAKLKATMDDSFLKEAHENFNAMYRNFSAALEKAKTE
jgi:hypothetical protein